MKLLLILLFLISCEVPQAEVESTKILSRVGVASVELNFESKRNLFNQNILHSYTQKSELNFIEDLGEFKQVRYNSTLSSLDQDLLDERLSDYEKYTCRADDSEVCNPDPQNNGIEISIAFDILNEKKGGGKPIQGKAYHQAKSYLEYKPVVNLKKISRDGCFIEYFTSDVIDNYQAQGLFEKLNGAQRGT